MRYPLHPNIIAAARYMPGPIFPDFKDRGFLPRYHPREMLEMGVSCSGIFQDRCAAAGLPREWFTSVSKGLRFGRPAHPVWPYVGEKTMVTWAFEADPGGWFQWYCRFCAGRRIPIDAFQISMWRRVGRWAILWSGHLAHDRDSTAAICQMLLEWSHDPDIALMATSSTDTSG